MSERQGAASWRHNLRWALIGAALQALSEAPLQWVGDALIEAYTHRYALLEQGNVLRGEAVREGSAAKHQAANAAFERAWAAGVPEALAQLGIAHCHGLGGYPRSWSQGHAMLIEAVRRNGALGAIYLGGDSDVCPTGK